jgi:hypothetical protein
MEPFCEPVGLYGKAVVPSFVAIWASGERIVINFPAELTLTKTHTHSYVTGCRSFIIHAFYGGIHTDLYELKTTINGMKNRGHDRDLF